ncbi:hypothetical protein [Actinokineospora cianjurensis]|uniref:Uncharacterized protein n=1 Tax=Actinokineospora cianjurensis TaxID=585224 RepID=A0A421B899_9PSEU|nr:hypothetical protein [Actinokineospora cianjurensis]RLK60594.1 hypothetical protein CLV68_1103 [Actinokineospora cianjurensis]
MSDDDLLAELRALLDRLDPMPARVREAAIAAGALLGIDWAELELFAAERVLVRGSGEVWRGDGVVVELGTRITGLVDHDLGVSHIELHSRDGSTLLRPDPIGTFSADLPDGRVRLVLHRSNATALVSPWLR